MTREAFAERVLAMQDQLYRISYSILGNPHDQADAAQECVARALARLDSLRNEAYFGTWLVRILMNVCNDILRRRTREVPAEAIEIIAPPQSDLEMVDALERLDLKYRLTLLLHYAEGYTTREVAEIMRVPEGTVKYRLVRARALLQAHLEERGAVHEATR